MDAHGCFMELMRSELAKRRASMVYDEELARKLELDSTVKQLCELTRDLSEFGGSERSVRSGENYNGRKSARQVSTVSKKLKSSYVSGGIEA